MAMPVFLQEKKSVPLFAIFIILLFPALLVFGSILRANFKGAAVQEAQKNLSALMYQSDRLVLDIDLELSFVDALFTEAFGRSGNAPDFQAVEAEYKSRARWPDLLTAVYLVENRQGRWTIRQALGPAASVAGNQNILATVQDYLSESRGLPESSGSRTAAFSFSGNPMFRVSSLLVGQESLRLSDTPAAEQRPAISLFVSQFDETIFTGKVLPVLVERYFGADSGFDGFEPAVYRPDGSLAYTQSSAELPTILPGAQEESDHTPRLPDFVRPLFRDPGRFDVSRFYRGTTSRAGEVEPAQAPVIMQSFRSRQDYPGMNSQTALESVQAGTSVLFAPDYIDQYRFYTHTNRDAWQLAVYRDGASIVQAAIHSARLKGLGAYAFLFLIYTAIVALYLALRRTAALAERERAFFASVSHELKTPIAVVLSAGENLAKGIVEAERLGTYGQTLAKEARRLGSSVERLLIIAGLQSTQGMHRDKPQELVALVESVLQKHGLETAVKVQAEGNPLVTGSILLLESAIDSIISNALKYGAPPYEISVAEGQRGIRHMAYVRCCDHGRGIPLGERRKVFEPFYRGSAAQQARQDGTGIGLYLARRVARIHGGDARLFSVHNGGIMVELSFKAYP